MDKTNVEQRMSRALRLAGLASPTVLSGEQEIRARALDGAARLLGSAVEDIAASMDHPHARQEVEAVWTHIAAAGAQYIAVGDVVAYPAADPI